MKFIKPSDAAYRELYLSSLSRFVPEESEIEWPNEVSVWWYQKEQCEEAHLDRGEKYKFPLPFEALVEGVRFDVIPDFSKISRNGAPAKYTLLSLHMSPPAAVGSEPSVLREFCEILTRRKLTSMPYTERLS